MGKELEIEGYDEVLQELQHEELVKAVKSVTNAITSLPKDDTDIKKLMVENRDAINTFVKAVANLKSEVKVETNQDKVVEAIGGLSKVLQGIGERLTVLEKKEKPLPVRLKAERGYNGNIDYVVIEYSK